MIERMRGLRPSALALALTMVFELSGCGGGGSNVRSAPASPPSQPGPSGSGGGGSGSGEPGPSPWLVPANSTLSVSRGESISRPIVLGSDATLDNAGAVGGMVDVAVEGGKEYQRAKVLNQDGGSIEGEAFGVKFGYGGTVRNDGVGSSIRSGGTAIQVLGTTGLLENTGGAVIQGASTAVYLEHGGTVTNGVGSTIQTTGGATGDCGGTGVCSIFVASDEYIPESFGGELTLVNAGTIIGNVQMISTASNDVTLFAGGAIQGDLDIGSSATSFLTLKGDEGTVQSYSQAVSGDTTFSGPLTKQDGGTWIIDRNLNASGTTVSAGTLQIGNGGAEGSVGEGGIVVYHGSVVFDRSDEIVVQGVRGNSYATDNELVQAGSGTLTIVDGSTLPSHVTIQEGTLQLGNSGNLPGCHDVCIDYWGTDISNDGALVLDSWMNLIYSGLISGSGSVTQNGSGGLILQWPHTYTGGTTVNKGAVLTSAILPGSATVNADGVLEGYSVQTFTTGLPGVANDLSNAGRVLVGGGNSAVGGDYTQTSSGTLAVSLGSKLDVAGSVTLNGGTLKVTGADSGYVSNTHTNVLTAAGGVTGTFDQLVKDTGVVFTATTINYDANSVWLDTTGLDVTTAAAGGGVSYTAASMGSAQRVQGAFQQLDDMIAAGDLSAVSGDFVRSAGQFQQAPTLQAAQASLQSLSGQLHAASAAMAFQSIDASSRALSDRFDRLRGQQPGFGVWTQDLQVGGDMARTGFDGVDFNLSGWLVGSDRPLGRSGVAGFAFGQSQGQQRLNQRFDHQNSRSTEAMLYAGSINGNWYTQGRVGFGSFRQDVSRQILLGYSTQGVSTRYLGHYNVAYGESGLHLGDGGNQITPFVSAQYASIARDGFSEQGAGGFGLRSDAQTLDRWQAGLGVRASHRWDLGAGRTVDFNARAQWQQTLATHGDVFSASLVGLQKWQPLAGIGLSRYSGLFGVGMDAALSANTALNFSYDYEVGQRETAQSLSMRVKVAF